jgi:hypothetical protein
VTAPSNAATNPDASLGGTSCTSAGNCVAVGSYLDSYGNGQAMEATEKGGAWEQATEITAPPSTATNPGAKLYAVLCTSAHKCIAVGTYEDTSSRRQAMAARRARSAARAVTG